MTELKIGIMPGREYQQYILDVVSGKRRIDPAMPTMMFSNIESLTRLIFANLDLLELIAQQRPKTMAELSQLSGRRPSNLSRTLKSLELHGLISLEDSPAGRGKKPVLLVSSLNIQIPFTKAASTQVTAVSLS
jgi:predicted transcriptional regulator